MTENQNGWIDNVGFASENRKYLLDEYGEEDLAYKHSIAANPVFDGITKFIHQTRSHIFSELKRPYTPKGVQSTNYVKRNNLETLLLESITELEWKNSNVVALIAPEGAGKTTLLQYVCYHELPQHEKADKFRVLEISTHPWYTAQNITDVGEKFYSSLLRLLSRKDYSSFRKSYEDFVNYANQKGVLLQQLNTNDEKKYVQLMMAYILFGAKHHKKFIIPIILLDQIDQLSFKLEGYLFDCAWEFITDIRNYSYLYAEIFDCETTDILRHEFRFIISLRPETYHSLIERQDMGSLLDTTVQEIDLTRNSVAFAWGLATRKVLAFANSSSRRIPPIKSNYRFGNAVFGYSTNEDAIENIQSLADYLEKNTSDKFLEEFVQPISAFSIRNLFSLFLKVLGHPDGYSDFGLKRLNSTHNKKTSIDHIVTQVIFDFTTMPHTFGEKKPFSPLNAFFMNDIRFKRDEYPLLGFQLLNVLDNYVEENSSLITETSIYLHLTDMGYPADVVSPAIQRFIDACLIARVPTEDKHTFRINSQTVRKYFELVTGEEGVLSETYFVQAIRDVIGLRTIIGFPAYSERAHLLATFYFEVMRAESRLADIINQRNVLHPKGSGKRFKVPKLSYLISQSYDRYVKKYKGIKSSLEGKSHSPLSDENWRRAFDLINNYCDKYYHDAKDISNRYFL